MKFLLIATVIVFSSIAQGQITIEDYPKKVVSQIHEIDLVEPVVASSSCGELTVSKKQTLFSGGCAGTIEMITTFTDACGNTATASQYINLRDEESPVFNTEEEYNLSAEEADVLPEPVVNDNSGRALNIDMESIREGNLLIQRFTATDICGNASSYDRRIILTDEL